MLAAATLIAVLDSIASQVQKFEDALGLTSVQAGTISAAAAGNRDVLVALNDASVANDLVPTFTRRVALVNVTTLYAALQGAMIARAVDVHYGGLGNIDSFLDANDLRVHWNLKKIGFSVSAKFVFPPVVDPVARYEGVGAGTGTFVAGSDVDTAQYGKTGMELVVEVMGASARDLRLTMKSWDGTTADVDLVVAANAPGGSTVAINGRHIGVANITTTNAGGTGADRFRVRSIVERALPPL